MSASITLANLSWSTPEGRPLLSGIDLSLIAERTGLVGRNGVGKTTLLKLMAGDLAPQAGRVSVNGTLGVLRQTVQVGAGETVADLFGVRPALALLERAEAGEADADEVAGADWTLEARLAEALARLGLDATPATRLYTTPRTTLRGSSSCATSRVAVGEVTATPKAHTHQPCRRRARMNTPQTSAG